MSQTTASIASPALPHRGKLLSMTLAALGVVYGDIGTSPLYAVNQIFFGIGEVPVTPDNVRGAISLVVWAITLVVSLKYLALVMRADNDGEGGVFALYGLLHVHKRHGMAKVLTLLMLGAGLLFGDGMITPAISVISAVEGLEVATPHFKQAVVPIAVVILAGLFAIQHKGTAKVGSVFGPLVLGWFAVMALLGLEHIHGHPEIVAALNPVHAVKFLISSGLRPTLMVLGAVMLVVTGGEALFADMGHFGIKPIRAGWFGVVYPSLVLNYLGQGAFLLSGAAVIEKNVFFSMVPHAVIYPVVLLAAIATVIASQALISGAFSLASQAVGLGLFPRLRIMHTHHAHAGHIYVPFINWALFVGCVVLVLTFQSSSALASAYGLAESGVMVTTTIAMVPVARLFWTWSLWRTLLLFTPLAIMDASFLLANSFKIFEGGLIPLSIGALIYFIMVTWRWGRKATFAAYSAKRTMTMQELIDLKRQEPSAIDRNLVLMVPKPLKHLSDRCPALFQFYWDRFGSLPNNLIFIEVIHRKVPHIHGPRCEVTEFLRDAKHGSVLSVTVTFGFMEDPNVEPVLEELATLHRIDLPRNPHRWIVHASIEKLLPGRRLPLWSSLRFRLFSLLRQISQPAYDYYGMGDQVQLTLEVIPVRLRDVS